MIDRLPRPLPGQELEISDSHGFSDSADASDTDSSLGNPEAVRWLLPTVKCKAQSEVYIVKHNASLAPPDSKVERSYTGNRPLHFDS